VVAFVTDLPQWTGLRAESAFVELASSFDDYVAKLRIDRDYVIKALVHSTNMSHVEAMEELLDMGMPRWREDTELATIRSEARRRLTPHSRGS
jgi:hypothetical protein